MCEPMRADGDQAGLQYLAKATNIFVNWKKSGTAGLTSKTFAACIQTMGAIARASNLLATSTWIFIHTIWKIYV